MKTIFNKVGSELHLVKEISNTTGHELRTSMVYNEFMDKVYRIIMIVEREAVIE